MNVRSYKIKKLLIDFILVNLVINAVFFLVAFKDIPASSLTLEYISQDLLIGLILLGMLCSGSNLMIIPKELLKGNVDLNPLKESKFHKLFPKSTIIRILILTTMTVVIFMPMFSWIPQLLGVSSISHLIGFGIKVVSAILAALIIGVIVLDLTLHDYRSMRTYKEEV